MITAIESYFFNKNEELIFTLKEDGGFMFFEDISDNEIIPIESKSMLDNRIRL